MLIGVTFRLESIDFQISARSLGRKGAFVLVDDIAGLPTMSE